MMSVSPPGRERKARDLNPHDLAAARFSKPARRTVSGYLPSDSTPGRTRTCDRLLVRELPLPLGHGSDVCSANVRGPSRDKVRRCATLFALAPAAAELGRPYWNRAVRVRPGPAYGAARVAPGRPSELIHGA